MKKSKIVNIAPEATHNSVYIFHNTEFNINLFVNACGADEAMEIFDACGFLERSQWKIFLELANQPAG